MRRPVPGDTGIPFAPGRRTYLASSRLPLACPGEPPAGRAAQGRAGHGGSHPSAAAAAPDSDAARGLPPSRDRPPRSVPPGEGDPRLPARRRLPATGGRHGTHPRLP